MPFGKEVGEGTLVVVEVEVDESNRAVKSCAHEAGGTSLTGRSDRGLHVFDQVAYYTRTAMEECHMEEGVVTHKR